MRLSSKIAFTEAVPEDSQLSSIWGGVFFHPSFVKNGAKYLGLEGSARTIEYDGNIVGISNVLSRKRVGIRAATIPLLFQYFGPVFYDPAFEENFFKRVVDYYEETCDFIYLSLTPEFNSIAQFSNDWTISKSTTLAVTEKEFGGWGNYFRDDVKNKINKANREKVRIVQSDSFNGRLWELSFIRKGKRPPIKPQDLNKWCSDLLDISILKIYSAFMDNVEVAFRGQLVSGQFAYDWIAGSDPDYHHHGTNQLLMAEIGSELKNKGITVWDLVDGSIKGIADFKKSFGAVEYHHWHACKAPGIKGKIFAALRRIKNA
ncbi:MAG: GNAT family N-acetyltransferase [Candidatus Zixiibacteriota bacterium]|nr:MAG: GNAT family N-acetyltransferase [candidate division Zixibacteria bacterium]